MPQIASNIQAPRAHRQWYHKQNIVSSDILWTSHSRCVTPLGPMPKSSVLQTPGLLMIQLPLGMGPSKACIFEAWSSKYIIWTNAFAFYTVACGHGAKWSSNIRRQYEVQSISLELVTGVFAHDTVAFGHGELAYLKHELQRTLYTSQCFCCVRYSCSWAWAK